MNTEQISRNIKSMAKAKGIKLGVIEKQAGVSSGYITRTKTNIKLEVVKTACEMLEVGLNELVNENLEHKAEVLNLNNRLVEVNSEMESLKAEEKEILSRLSEIEGENYDLGTNRECE